jgi:predicted Fe-Mo cluster-binding NifX family protein
MRIAVSASRPELDSPVDVRFGRCPYFILVETEGRNIKSYKPVENASANQVGGAGLTAAQAVADLKADAIITANMGPKAFTVFQQLGIAVYNGSGTVREAVTEFLSGKLHKMQRATGPGHAGLPDAAPGRSRA